MFDIARASEPFFTGPGLPQREADSINRISGRSLIIHAYARPFAEWRIRAKGAQNFLNRRERILFPRVSLRLVSPS